MSASTVVGGDGDRRVDRGHRSPRVGRDERLIAEADDHDVGAERHRGIDARPQ
jgi:hypothetical protein